MNKRGRGQLTTKGHTGAPENEQVLGNRFVGFLRDIRNRLLELVRGCTQVTVLLCGHLQIAVGPAVSWNPGQSGKAEWERVFCVSEDDYPTPPQSSTHR